LSLNLILDNDFIFFSHVIFILFDTFVYGFSKFKSMVIHACFHTNLDLMFENPYTNGLKDRMM